MLRRALGAEVELVVRLKADVRLVKVDPRQLTRVLINIAINARDAMPEGGSFIIETRNAASEAPPDVDAATPDLAVISIPASA